MWAGRASGLRGIRRVALVWSWPCRVGRLFAGEEGLKEGAGGGAERKLYVILGWLLNNCFNEMECSVFSTYLAETMFFFLLFSILEGEKEPELLCFPAALNTLGLHLSQKQKWNIFLGEGAVALLCMCETLSLYIGCVSGRVWSLGFSEGCGCQCG